MAGPAKHWVMLDSVRGVAAFLVVLYHLGFATNLPALSARLPSALIDFLDHHSGQLGVPAFFVLSGFVMTAAVRRSGASVPAAGQFVARRMARIAPPYYVSIGITIGVALLGAVAQGDAFVLEEVALTPLRLLSHLVFAQAALGQAHISSVYWTLVYEMAFYLCCAGLLVVRSWLGDRPLFGRVRSNDAILVAVTVAVAVAAFGHSQGELGAFAFVRMAYCFVLGVLVAASSTERWRLWLVGLLGVAALAAGLQIELSTRLAAVGTAALILVALERNGLDTWMRQRPLQFLGKVSFSLYLVHAPVQTIARHTAARVPGPELAGEALLLAVGIGGSIAAAWVMWAVVERPAQRWSSQIVFARPAPATATVAASAGESSPSLVAATLELLDEVTDGDIGLDGIERQRHPYEPVGLDREVRTKPEVQEIAKSLGELAQRVERLRR